MMDVKEIISAFPDYGEVISSKPITAGHINDTYIVEYKLADGSIAKYLLQRMGIHQTDGNQTLPCRGKNRFQNQRRKKTVFALLFQSKPPKNRH